MITTKASRLNNLAHTLAPWTLPVLLLAVWQLSVSAGWLSTRILPAPSAVIAAGVELVRSGEIWKHLAISGWRAGLGFVIGGSIGLADGYLPLVRDYLAQEPAIYQVPLCAAHYRHDAGLLGAALWGKERSHDYR